MSDNKLNCLHAIFLYKYFLSNYCVTYRAILNFYLTRLFITYTTLYIASSLKDKIIEIQYVMSQRNVEKITEKIDFVELSLLLQIMGHTMCGTELKIQNNS